MNVYMKRVKGLDYRPGVTQRWVARDGMRVGVGKTRIEATRKMRPNGESVIGSFDQRFLAAGSLRWTHPSEP